VIGIQSAYTLAGGLISAVAVLLLLPILETVFGLTSDIRLLELTDPSHPLLERLALEAPGTYHHSLMVAHLAQSAAQAIGANDLLVRVGALYHDIGKLAKPEYFIENQRPGENPHDELSPSMSRLIITSHVKEGLQLARRHRLPRPVLDAIEQHHGTSRVGYFFDRYLRRAADAGGAAAAARHEGEFRYPGPTPLSREMAVLALADTVEAAARSLERPSPARLRELVRALLLQKIKDGQLRSADLTLAEVEEVQNAFVFTLLSMSHGRIAYPDSDHGGAPAGGPAGANGEAANAGALPDAPGGAAESGAPVDGGGDRPAE
jgi:cyclic-di-AMP phosphodiesterase PgpH